MGNITNSSVFLVSGGARGITAQCVIEIAKHYHSKFILLGRTALQDEPEWAIGGATEADLKKKAIAAIQGRGEKPTPIAVSKLVNGVIAQREIRQTLATIKQVGGDALYLSADISNVAALQTALSNANTFGTINGILHGAGNLADKLIENKTEADFENVYSAKVEGLENLLAAIPNAQLEFLILFSSVAGFYGNVGQADYAIANEILNKTAHRFKKLYPQCHVVSVNWGPWDGGMVTPQLREYFDKLDIRVIPVEVGTQMLVQELGIQRDEPVQVVIGSAIRPQPTFNDKAELQTYQLRRSLRLEDNLFLADHVVDNQAVLPMVAAMTWIANTAEQIHRGYRYYGFSNYRVLKGIVFNDELASEYILELKEISKSADEIVMDAMIRSKNAEGKLRFHYSSQITLRAQLPDAPICQNLFNFDGQQPIPGAGLYTDGTLFHGYSFQGIDTVLGINEQGLSMRCRLPEVGTDYQGQFPIQAFNYFMADIGLQSLGIWARHIYDAGSLPLRAGSGEFFTNVTLGQVFYVTMEVVSHSETNVTANVKLHNEHNQVSMMINGIEVTLSKRLNELFMRNRIPSDKRLTLTEAAQ